MKEYLFRAWSKTKKRWLSAEEIEYGVSKVGSNEFLVIGSLGVHGYQLVQYLGLKDKHGKLIWEGDILKDEEGEMIEVSLEDASSFSVPDYIPTDTCEVIGNIFEDPELCTPQSI